MSTLKLPLEILEILILKYEVLSAHWRIVCNLNEIQNYNLVFSSKWKRLYNVLNLMKAPPHQKKKRRRRKKCRSVIEYEVDDKFQKPIIKTYIVGWEPEGC